MIPAFFGIDGRSLASHVAALAAVSLARDGNPVQIVRVTVPGETNPAPLTLATIGKTVSVVEIVARHDDLNAELDLYLGRAVPKTRLVLDLPASALRDGALTDRPEVLAIVPIGPFDLPALRMRASAFGLPPGSSYGDRARPRVLACGWMESGLAGETAALVAAGVPRAALLPFALPPLSRSMFAGIAHGSSPPGMVALGEALVEAIRDAGHERTASNRYRTALAESCWRLAFDVEAYEAGIGPSADELHGAAEIDEWSESASLDKALSGRIWGESGKRPGRRAVTSAVVHSDGRTYARTLSRLYKLGRPSKDVGVA